MKKILQLFSKIVLFCAIICSQISLTGLLEPAVVSLFGPDVDFHMSGKFKPESFYAKNSKLLNSCNLEDEFIFNRHTLDLKMDFVYGKCTYGEPVAQFFFDLRNKAVWGNPNSIASTAPAETKVLEAVGRPHSHFFPRHILWMRQVWLEFDVGAALAISFFDNHKLKFGAFPFELGRGIALGDAYAVGPETLGFYSPDAVDQYAFGAKLSGNIFSHCLSYDLYTAILSNKSGQFSDTGEKLFGQQYGRLNKPERGFGHIDYIFAGRLKFDLSNDTYGSVHIEPYALYNSDPENNIQFRADAKSELSTFGLYTEFVGNCLEFGFDTAVNVGNQKVRGWDRNEIIEKNSGGVVTLINSKVGANIQTGIDDMNNPIIEFVNIPYVEKSEAQAIINNSLRSEFQNGKVIGSLSESFDAISKRPLTTTSELMNMNAHTHNVTMTLLQASATDQIVLQNVEDRFRDPYINKYQGWMFVADAAAKFWSDSVQIAVTAGVASGDDNPNLETIDGDYKGFIPLQEVYSGKRVKSAFLLGGAGKLRRPISIERNRNDQSPTKIALKVSGFTNLIFTGAALHYKSTDSCRDWHVNPNVLAYWQEHNIAGESDYLGTEVALFADMKLLADMKLFVVGSVFIPGQHYTDISGKKITQRQEDRLDQLDRTGFEADPIPSLADDVAFTFNVGLEYTF